MSTVVMSKKRFLYYMEGQLSDADIVLVTVDKSGHIKYNKRTQAKSVTFDFAAECFASKEDIRDLWLDCPTAAFAICKEKDLTKDTFDMVKIGDEKFLPKNSKRKQIKS